MNTESHDWKVNELIGEREKRLLLVNDEYQRGDNAWRLNQQQRLVDSVLRGYHLPVFYFHKKSIQGRAGTSAHFEIVDGQQRATALERFKNDVFCLLDPQEASSNFPMYLRQTECTWANKRYSELTDADRNKFDLATITVAQITDTSDDEVRDLFIRLQSGSDLKPQERRDAFPGQFCAFVNHVGGRLYRTAENERILRGGHDVFTKLMHMKPMSDRGRTREFVARLMIQLYLYRRAGEFVRLTQQAIDDFYYHFLDWDSNGEDSREFRHILDDIWNHMEGYHGPAFKPHEILHSLILWLELEYSYSDSWKVLYSDAISEFKRQLNLSVAAPDDRELQEIWIEYGALIRTASNEPRTMKRRHNYFRRWMLEELKPSIIDVSRSFSPEVRERVYHEAQGICEYSDQSEICTDTNVIDFYEAQIHHIIPHAQGGASNVENAALTHKRCNQRIGNSHIRVKCADGSKRDGQRLSET